MTDRPAPQVHILYNPWPETVPNGVLLQKLTTVSVLAEEKIREWIKNALEAPDAPRDISARPDATFAQVYLDPTRRHWPDLDKSVMAYVLFGDPKEARVLLPNALAKADAVFRHGMSSGELVDEANFLLDDEDFAWGGGVMYRGAIGAGSGLTEWQDGRIVVKCLEPFVDSIHRERRRLIKEARSKGMRGWYNSRNKPSDRYARLAQLILSTPSITQAF